MAKRNHINNQSGIALVIALVMLLALTVIGISALMTSTLDTQMSGNERRAAEALNLADAGIERGLMDLLTDFTPSPTGDGDWSNNTFKHMSLATVDATVTDTLGAASGNFAGNIDQQWGDPFDSATVLNGPDGNAVTLYNGPVELPSGSGNYYRVLVLRDSSVKDEVYLRSYAQHSTGAKKVVQVHLEVEKVDAWRNAIFAGRGSGANVIQGNIKVAGSIHILGTGEEDVVFALRGTAGMHNGYKDLASDLKNRISDDYIKRCILPSGLSVECLEAVMRVKKGHIDLGGTGAIGEQGGSSGTGCSTCPDGARKDASGDFYKSNVDSVFSNQGFTNASFTDNVFADNFDPDVQEFDETEEYDLGDKVRMPQFNDPYDGQLDRMGKTCAQRGLVCDTYEHYIDATSLELNDFDGNPGTVDPICHLVPNGTGSAGAPVTGPFCKGCPTTGGNAGKCPKEAELDPICFSDWDHNVNICGDRKGCIQWNPGTNSTEARLTVEGRVKFSDTCTASPGDPVNIMGRGSNTISYDGKGILYSDKYVNIQGDLVSYAGTAGAEEYFIEDNLLAVMTKSDMKIGTTGNPIDAMGAFYALGNMVSNQSSQIVGSLMSNSFDMTGGTTSIYYVDQMSDELYKMGMIRSEMVYTFKKYEWEEKW